MDFDQENDIKTTQLNTTNDITNRINILYHSYNNSRSKESLMELINIIIENIHTPNIRDFLELKIDNETIFDIMIKLKINFDEQVAKYICSQNDFLIKVIKNGDVRILDFASEDIFFKNIDGITIFEYLISNNKFYYHWMYKFEKKYNIIEILKKYGKEELLKFANETILFEKFDNNKLVIEYLFENDMVSDIERIKYHPEIIDYIEKYKKNYLLPLLAKEILESKKDNKLILEYILEKGITPHISEITNIETINILLKYKKYSSLREITIEHAFEKVQGSDKKLFEFLLTHGVVSYNVLEEIYYNTKYANQIYEILKRNHGLNLLNGFSEEKLLLKYGTDETLFESLLKDKMLFQTEEYKLKESLDLLLKYNRYDELSKCKEDLLLSKLSNGKYLYEELIDRNIRIKTDEITSEEITKKIIRERKFNQLSCLSSKVLIKDTGLNQTYLDIILEVVNKEEDYQIINYLNLNYETLNEKAKLYIIFAKNNLHKVIQALTINELIEEKENTTLLDELLQENQKITLNKILTEEQKSNPHVASILKLYGIRQKNINYKIITKNLAEEYTNQEIKELENMPIIPEQEKLLQELFIVMNDAMSEPERLNALIASYRYLLSTNNQYAKEIYHLIELKKQNPYFRIEKTEDTSHFNSTKHRIGLENLNIGTLNHEIAHALHYMIDNYSYPKDFEKLIKRTQKSIKTKAMVTLFSKKYIEVKRKVARYVDRVIMEEYDKSITEDDKEKIQKYLDTLNTEQREEYEKQGYTKQLLDLIFGKTFTVNDYLRQTRSIQRNEMIDRIMRTEYPHYIAIGDFFDGIYEGKLRDGKLKDVLGLTYLKSSYGHGIEYYKDDIGMVFKEMIANYSSVMKSKYSKEGIELLKYYLGDELIQVISNYYNQNICYNYSYIEQKNKTL